VDLYGLITPTVGGFEYPPDVSLVSSDTATGTWVYFHKAPGVGQAEVSVLMPDQTNFSIGIT
jgi:hypothetical protein